MNAVDKLKPLPVTHKREEKMNYIEMRKWLIDFFFEQYKVYWKYGQRQYVTFLPASVDLAFDDLVEMLNKKTSMESV